VNKNSQLYSIFIYCHPQYTARNYNEQREVLDWGLIVYILFMQYTKQQDLKIW